MSKGIVLMAFGDPCYGYAAYNLAVSLKFHSPEIPIHLLHDQKCFSKGRFNMKVFDGEKIIIPDYKNPGLTKAGIYQHLPFEENLYIDVDSMALQDVAPLFDRMNTEQKNYAVMIHDVYDKDSPEEMPAMFWAHRSTIWEHYNLNGHKMPATQSSIQYIRKSDEAEQLFKRVNENMLNPIPLNKLRNQWGGTQPDELYLNVALAQMNMNPNIGNDIMFFANRMDKRSISEIQTTYLFLSLFGGRNFTRPIYQRLYDQSLIKYFGKLGDNHRYKSNFVLARKHSDKKTVRPVEVKSDPMPQQPAEIKWQTLFENTILLKFPTRSRPEKFLLCLEKALSLAEDKSSIKALVSIDGDDSSMTPEVLAKAKEMGQVLIISGESKNKVHAINRDMEQAGEWDILVLLSDDMECEVKGWDRILKQTFAGNLDQLLHFNDGYRKSELLTLPIMGRQYYNRFGYIYHPDYISLWSDNEQMEVGRKLRKSKYFPEILFRHKMAMNGFHQDDLHKHTESFFDIDKKTFMARKAKNFGL